MPKIQSSGIDDVVSVFSDLEKDIDSIAKMGIYDGVAVVADALKAACPQGPTGDLAESVGVARMRQAGGGWNTIVGFSGYDANGVPNQLKARVLESGRSVGGKTVAKHPFVRKTVNRVRNQVVAAIQKQIEDQINERTGGN